MREQRIQLLAHLAINPLRIGLPAGDRLEPGGALERHRLGESAIEDERGLVDLQCNCDPLLGP